MGEEGCVMGWPEVVLYLGLAAAFVTAIWVIVRYA
jgi:hypothetical protein